jgi:acetyl-CoA carboxylase biotin carboxyl carrier protein
MKEPAVAEIRAEMVANVWRVLVSEGDQVEDGDTLVILESMKMEIPVLAETAGVVAKLHVAEGDVVQEDELIAVIDLPALRGPTVPPLNSEKSALTGAVEDRPVPRSMSSADIGAVAHRVNRFVSVGHSAKRRSGPASR